MKNILLLFLTFLLACQSDFRENDKQIQAENETSDIGEKENIGNDSSKTENEKNKGLTNLNQFNGDWVYSSNNEIQDYRLSLSVDSVSFLVQGSHCFIRGEMGDYIDCSDNSIKGMYNNGLIAGEIKSDMTNESYPYVLKIELDKLVFHLKSEPKTSFFQKEMTFQRGK